MKTQAHAIGPARAANTLRAEWQALLTDSMADRDGFSGFPNFHAAQIGHVRTLLAALELPCTANPFSCEFSSVGNPDMAQYHGKGIASPTFTAHAPTIATLVEIMLAYIAVYDLGSGNLSRDCGVVYRGRVEVARISYNGRVWAPGKWPTKEIVP